MQLITCVDGITYLIPRTREDVDEIIRRDLLSRDQPGELSYFAMGMVYKDIPRGLDECAITDMCDGAYIAGNWALVGKVEEEYPAAYAYSMPACEYETLRDEECYLGGILTPGRSLDAPKIAMKPAGCAFEFAQDYLMRA